MNDKKLKILFAISATNQLTHYISIIEALIKKGYFLYILFDKYWTLKADIVSIKKLRSSPQIKIGWIKRRSGLSRKILFTSREILSYRRYLLFTGQSEFYLNRAKKNLPGFFRFLSNSKTFNSLLMLPITKSLLKLPELLIPPDQKIISAVKKQSPDVIIAGPANMRFSEEIEYIKAAKALRIPTIIPVISWDSLTTKGLIHVCPDKLLAWNKAQQQEAIQYHDIPKQNIKIIGSPFFDKWFKEFNPTKKEAFFHNIGLDHNKPLLLYLGSSATIAYDELWLVKKILMLLKRSKNNILQSAQLMIRPHPMNADIYKSFSSVSVHPIQGCLVNSQKDLQFFFDTLFYSKAVLGINTSGMIDALINNKPVIAIMAQKYKSTQQEALHFTELVKADAIEETSIAQLEKQLSVILGGGDKKFNQRKVFVKKFIRPCGLQQSAASIAVNVVENFAR